LPENRFFDHTATKNNLFFLSGLSGKIRIMKYAVRKLKLYTAIHCAIDTDDGNGMLKICTSVSDKKNLEVKRETYLVTCPEPARNTEIPKGDYLFVQGFLPPDRAAFADEKPAPELITAAEELWLEFLWEDFTPADTIVYVRFLLHENEYTDTATGEKKSAGTVFQLYRRTKEEL
jgi:hypothetical protein